MLPNKIKLVILDRDGVINQDSKDFIRSPAQWQPIPGSLEAIAQLNQAGYMVVVATNQSGVGRGYYSEADLAAIHQKMHKALQSFNGMIDRVFYCPHHPEEHCECRKPGIGLFKQIAQAYPVDLTTVPMIGDSLRDLQAAQAVGCHPILVLTGQGKQTLQDNPQLVTQVPVFEDLKTVVHYLLVDSSTK